MAVEPVGTKNDWEVNLLGAISATDIISIIKKEIEDFDWDDSAREPERLSGSVTESQQYMV